MSEYSVFIYYTEFNIVCVIFFAIMLIHDLLNAARQETQIRFDNVLVSFMLYFLSDSLWAAVTAGILPRNRVTVLSSNLANHIILAGVTYMWLRYVMAVEREPRRERPVYKLAALFPFLLSTLVLVAVYCIAPQILLDDAMKPKRFYDVFMITVPVIYVAAAVLYTVGRARRVENPVEKKRHLLVGLLPLIVIAGGIVQTLLVPTTPLFCFTCTILMLALYIHSMETRISMDPLTGLNNRGQLHRYVSQRSNVRMEGRRTFVVMIDVNDFKGINDTYGHAEGDRALILISGALRKAVNSRSTPTFLGRYGGDEFILIAHPTDEKGVEQLAGEIRAQIRSACKTAETPYELSVGIGYDELLNEPDTIQKCMQRADHKLYLDKEYVKLHGGTPARG